MAHGIHPGVEVRLSAVDGHGLFATSSFAAGDRFRVASDVSDNQVTMTDEEFNAYLLSVDTWDAVYLGNGQHRVTLGPREDNPANYGNHGCNPNVKLMGEELQALRDIQPGDELLIDYAELSPTTWSMPCYCAALTCRGTVTGNL